MAKKSGRPPTRRPAKPVKPTKPTKPVKPTAPVKPVKPVKPPKPPKPPAAGSGAAPQVRVRMYRQGLGDCFLLTFDVSGPTPVHMLIDCGTLGAKTTGVAMDQVFDDIKATTGGKLAVLIATHEHKDHVSGFKSLQKRFVSELRVERVWLAWTEDPTDALAKKIAKRKDDLAAALIHASAALKADGAPAAAATAHALDDILAFSGDPEKLGAGDFAETINAAMQFVRTKLTRDVTYWSPGKVIEPSWLDGFRFYVLGPPRSEVALDNTGESGGDLFGLAAALRCGAAFRASGQSAVVYESAVDRETRDDFVAAQPFDRRFRIESERFGGQGGDIARSYLADADGWRRVDGDWLNVASDLALQLDSSTNNTSLALAIERVADGKVLLMPADAQQGNWLSWHDATMVFTVSGGAKGSGGAQSVRAADLLARAVFYKAGHHASHNGTMRTHGLEMMKQESELVAFIPVDRAVALGRNPQGSWRMPAVKLYRAMLDKCQGRVVRSDIGWAEDAAVAKDKETEKELRGLATAAEWKQWKQSQAAATGVRVTPLFVDYLLD